MLPTDATLPEWLLAMALAARFWQDAAQDLRISSEFRRVAAKNADHFSAQALATGQQIRAKTL